MSKKFAVMKLTLRLYAVFAFALLFIKPALALEAQLKSSDDGSQIEFTGKTFWEYNIERKEGSLDLRLEGINDEIIQSILQWKDNFIEKVELKQKTDLYAEFTIHLKDKRIQSFDYQMESPSRLLIDFYREKQTPVAKAEAKTQTKQTKKYVTKKLPKKATDTSSRKPASEMPIEVASEPEGSNEKSSAENTSETVDAQEFKGLKDGADPNYERFQIKDYEISKKAQIAAQKNVFVNFPFLTTPNTFIKLLEENTPIYEIKEEKGPVAERVKLLQTVFNNKRYALFLTGLSAFNKEVPESRYQHLLRYMEADANYYLWKETNEEASYSRAMSLYKKLLEDFPKSPLYERTRLLIAYSKLSKKNYIPALQEFLSILSDIPETAFKDEINISIGDTFLALNKFEDAISTYKKVLDSETAGTTTKYKAAFKIGDVLAQQKQYDATIASYKEMLKRFPAGQVDAPNAYYNIGESLFRQNRYLEAHTYFLEFLKRFPMHKHGGYALNRVGEVLEILTENSEKINGAYLENTFRFNNSPGAFISKLRLDVKKMPQMKNNEIEQVKAQIADFNKGNDAPEFKHLTTILFEEGLFRRGDLVDSLKVLQDFYKDNPTSNVLDFYRKRIARNLTAQMKENLAQGKYINALRLYGSNKAIWLKDADRLDLDLYLAQTFEKTSALDQAVDSYRQLLNKLMAIHGTEEALKREVLEDLPKIDVVNLRLANTYFQQNEFERSLQHLNMIEETKHLNEEQNLERLGLLADIAIQKNEYGIAETYLGKIIHTKKALPEEVTRPYFKLTDVYLEQKKSDDAKRVLDKIIHFHEDSGSISDEMYINAYAKKADILLKEGNKSLAQKYYQDLISKFEDKEEVINARYNLGNLYFEKGDIAKAEETWKALEKFEKGQIWYKIAQEKLDGAKWTDSYKKYLERLPAGSRSE